MPRPGRSSAPDRGAVCGYLAGAIGALGEEQTTGTNKVRFRFPATEQQVTPANITARQPSCAQSVSPSCAMTPERHIPATAASIEGGTPAGLPSWAAPAGAAAAGCGVHTGGGSASQPHRLEGSPARLPKPVGEDQAVLNRCRKTDRLGFCSRPPAVHLEPRPARRGGDLTASPAPPGREPFARRSHSDGTPARFGPAYAAPRQAGKRTVRHSRRKVFNEKGNADQRPPARREPHRHH